MTDKTLKDHVKKCGDLKAKIDDLTALFNHEKDYIIDALKERETSDFSGSGYTVKYIEYTKKQIDTARLKKDNLYNMYLKESNTARFTVKTI